MDNEDLYVMYLRKSRSDIEYEKTHPNYDTLARHEIILKNLSILKKYNIAKVYKEVVSGETISDRPKIQHLLEEIKLKKYKGILVVECSRLTRGEKIDQGVITRILEFTNTLVITPEKVYDLSNSKDKELFEDELTNANKELNTIKGRLIRGRLSSVYEGKYVGNTAPLGYKRVKIEDEKGFTLEELPEESIIVKKIFDLYVYDDLSINKITAELDKMNYKPRISDKWSPSTIKDILRNPVYVGCIRWNHRKQVKSLDFDNIEKLCISRPRNNEPIVVNGLHSGLISQEIWDLTQAKLSKNSAPVQHNNVIKNPLSHILICEKCGSYMQRRPYAKSGETTAIQCNNTSCNNISSKLHIVESKIIEALRYWLENYKVSQDSLNHKKELCNINYYENLIKQLNENIEMENKRLDKICQAYEDGVYNEDVYQKRYKEIEEAIVKTKHLIIEYTDQLKKEQKLAEDKEIIIPKMENVLDVYYKLETAEEKNRLLKTVVEKVTYLKVKKTLKKTDDPTDFEIHIFPKIPKY